MKRAMTLVIILLLLHGSACAEYWTASTDRPAVCCDDRPGCQVLQAVMMGSFAEFDPVDRLNVRVLAAALPRLSSVTDDDFAHFCDNYNMDEATLRQFYYMALGKCLWADMILSPQVEDADEQNARTVLHLFLNPSKVNDAQSQMEAIRANATVQTLAVISEGAGVPIAFVEYLIYNGN